MAWQSTDTNCHLTLKEPLKWALRLLSPSTFLLLKHTYACLKHTWKTLIQVDSVLFCSCWCPKAWNQKMSSCVTQAGAPQDSESPYQVPHTRCSKIGNSLSLLLFGFHFSFRNQFKIYNFPSFSYTKQRTTGVYSLVKWPPGFPGCLTCACNPHYALKKVSSLPVGKHSSSPLWCKHAVALRGGVASGSRS